MATVNASALSFPARSLNLLASQSFSPFALAPTSILFPTESTRYSISTSSYEPSKRMPIFAVNNKINQISTEAFDDAGEEKDFIDETRLYSVAPLPLLVFAALPGAETVRSVFGPFVELVKSWNLPDWLVHWGHPGNMAVVLFAMGGYGTYLGFRIKFSDDVEEKAKAKDLHPKLLGGMFFFFALGATGGITSLLTSDKPILESPHAVTGIIGLALLSLQSALPALFEELVEEIPKRHFNLPKKY
ncbi:OLC1v1034490C1 [Oldenlandia corymbosa var. corymbosa]|uniref:OLC1v1034490C1 n=1 Tax=Oldenlandia corymbosa var. corymbosa TaxID=529605 RepID=A0AAV1CTQ1_OLDCO|nr:OLC1v1034490C1 [Oldenlandia corymbosa var. corymbosa]